MFVRWRRGGESPLLCPDRYIASEPMDIRSEPQPQADDYVPNPAAAVAELASGTRAGNHRASYLSAQQQQQAVSELLYHPQLERKSSTNASNGSSPRMRNRRHRKRGGGKTNEQPSRIRGPSAPSKAASVAMRKVRALSGNTGPIMAKPNLQLNIPAQEEDDALLPGIQGRGGTSGGSGRQSKSSPRRSPGRSARKSPRQSPRQSPRRSARRSARSKSPGVHDKQEKHHKKQTKNARPHRMPLR